MLFRYTSVKGTDYTQFELQLRSSSNWRLVFFGVFCFVVDCKGCQTRCHKEEGCKIPSRSPKTNRGYLIHDCSGLTFQGGKCSKSSKHADGSDSR